MAPQGRACCALRDAAGGVGRGGNLAGTRCGIKQRRAQPCVRDVCGATQSSWAPSWPCPSPFVLWKGGHHPQGEPWVGQTAGRASASGSLWLTSTKCVAVTRGVRRERGSAACTPRVEFYGPSLALYSHHKDAEGSGGSLNTGSEDGPLYCGTKSPLHAEEGLRAPGWNHHSPPCAQGYPKISDLFPPGRAVPMNAAPPWAPFLHQELLHTLSVGGAESSGTQLGGPSLP